MDWPMIPFSQIWLAIGWLLTLYLCSLIGIALFIKPGSRFSILRYSVGKTVGFVAVGAISWVLSLIKIVPFSFVWLWLMVILSLAVLLAIRGRSLAADFKTNWRIYLTIELVFVLLFVIGIAIRATNPKIIGVEKLMDSAILTNLLRHQKGVPLDTWYAPDTINYYYFGQWMIAAVAKMSRVGANYAFNLGLATVLGLAGTSVFCLAWQLAKKRFAGILAVFLTFFASNLQPFIAWLGGQHNYFFYNSGRFTAELISEYPFYSVVLGDIHAHVLALIISTALYGTVALIFLENDYFRQRLVFAMVAGGLAGLLVATSTFDVISAYIVFGLAMVALWHFKRASARQAAWLFIGFAAASGLSALPFLLTFKPGVGGVGFSFMNIPLKYLFWQFGLPLIIAAAAYLLIRRQHRLQPKDSVRMAIIFGIAGLILVLTPEFFFLKDIYYFQNPPYETTNTIFKLWYCAWPLIAVSAAVLASRAIYDLKKLWRPLSFSCLIVGCALLAVGTKYGMASLKDGESASLDGYSYLKPVILTSWPLSIGLLKI